MGNKDERGEIPHRDPGKYSKNLETHEIVPRKHLGQGVEMLIICGVRVGVWQTVRHERAKGYRLALHHGRYIPRRHLGPGNMEGQASLPEVYATTITRKIRIERACHRLRDEAYLSPSVSAAVTNISWGVAFLDG